MPYLLPLQRADGRVLVVLVQVRPVRSGICLQNFRYEMLAVPRHCK